jgi:hypothetical protein
MREKESTYRGRHHIQIKISKRAVPNSYLLQLNRRVIHSQKVLRDVGLGLQMMSTGNIIISGQPTI